MQTRDPLGRGLVRIIKDQHWKYYSRFPEAHVQLDDIPIVVHEVIGNFILLRSNADSLLSFVNKPVIMNFSIPTTLRSQFSDEILVSTRFVADTKEKSTLVLKHA